MENKAVIKAIIMFAATPTGRRLFLWALNSVVGKDLAGIADMSLNILSDEDMKDVKAIASRGGPFSIDEVALLSLAAGDHDGHNINEDDDEYDDDILDKYAEHLRNYVYTYKPEAQSVDSSIDPNEEHVGIMAQDLEKVNPACVQETPEGVKTVNTGRLALMNAGAIGDLARRIEKLEGGV